VSSSLDQSFEFCRRLTKREAGNFYFSFLTLPKAKRDAMCAIYAWMRRLDDLADDAPSPAAARETLAQWRMQTRSSLNPKASSTFDISSTLWPAFAETVKHYNVPHPYFDEIIEGALMDQEVIRYATFDDLYRYCYRVASVVGLVCLHIFEYSDPQAEKNGEWLGIAFQLTNILRDVKEDAKRGRIYLPLKVLQSHGVSEKDILEQRWSEDLGQLLRSFADQTEEYYVRAKPVVGLVSKEARPTLRIMTEIYHGILLEIRKMNYRVFEKRARLSTPRKMAIVLKHYFG
jgi:phytoene synthase